MTEYKGMAVERDGESYTTRRESREALVLATLDFGPRRDPKLDTTLAFFDHMLEMLGWYADINVDASYEVRTYRLMQICADCFVPMTKPARWRRSLSRVAPTPSSSAGEPHHSSASRTFSA